MFDAVRNNKRVVQAFLVLITLPFAFFGVESYVRNAGGGDDVAKVGKTKISLQEFQRAYREQQERLRGTLGANFDAKMFDTPEARLSVVNGLIDQRLLLVEAAKNHLYASDAQLAQVITRIPALQENGKFSQAKYEEALRAQNLTVAGFEAQLRQDLTLQQIVGAVADSGLVAKAQAAQVLRIQLENREVASYLINLASVAAKVKVDDAAARQYYDSNAAQFQLPEQVKAEYVVLSADALKGQSNVSDADVKAWYDSHQDRYQQPEERRASHILVMVDAAAPAADKDKAKAKVQALLAEVKANPGKFAEIAKKDSQDPGSAANGGDLGFFAKGAMVKPFEDAVFSLKEGEVSGVVQSDFGYHIIKLTGIKPGKVKSFESVKGEIEAELKAQAAGRKYAEAAENFSNLVYEQSDSLKPAADKYKLAIQTSGWLSKGAAAAGAAQAATPANPKVLEALFSNDALKDKRNTAAIEVAPNTLVAARVVEHKPAAQRPFDEVKAAIVERLTRQEEQKLVKQEGDAQLAKLQSGDDKVTWSPVKSVSRMTAAQLSREAAQAIFKADVKKLPAYVGVELPGNGYGLFKITKVQRPEKVEDAQVKGLQEQYAQFAAQQDTAAYLAALRKKYSVEINKSALETKER